jgi:hypothetical protein
MGFRTVVMLNNDHDWLHDPELGIKINRYIYRRLDSCQPNDGIKVIEQVHADTVSLLKLSFYNKCENMAYTRWDNENGDITLLKSMADKLGYRVVKKS